MREIKRRVFAAAIAAALLFTMPGMASYAEAEDARTEEISESVTVQAGDDTAQETAAETEVIQEPETEDSETDQPETGEDDTGDTETDAQEPAEEETVPAQKEDAEECTCGILCTQDSINGDCPVCGAEDADLSRCKGEKKENNSQENKEDAGQEDTGAQDDSANLCAHHKEHTEDCGYSRLSEDGEGSPCTYDCKLCPIEDLIAALPDEVTEDNAEKVRALLNKILALYQELTEDEQAQLDLTLCSDLLAALDEANVPALIDEPAEGTVAQVEIDGNISDYNAIDAAWTAANGNTATITLLADVTANGTLTVDSGSTITFVGGDHTLTSGQKTTIEVNGTLNLVSGTIHSTCSDSGATGINVHGTLEMTGGTVTTSNSTTSGAMAVQTDSNSIITISGGKIFGSYGIDVNGGTVTIQKGEISSRRIAVYILSGTVTIEGGTFTGSFYGMDVRNDSKVVLRGGTFTGGNMGCTITSQNDVSALLDTTKPYVYFDANGQPVNLSNLEDPKKLPSGTFTVGECTHLGVLKDNGDGTHGGDCPYCGTALEAAPHTPDADNKCEGCGTKLVAQVEIGNVTTYYGGFEKAWDAAQGKTATITLLDNVTENLEFGMSGGDITLNGGEHTHAIGIRIGGGSLAITGGTFTGEPFVLSVPPGASGTVNLSGGTFIGSGNNPAVACASGVGNLLAEGYAYFNKDGPIATAGKIQLNGTIMVDECEHTGVKPTSNNDGTHSINCPYCGYKGTSEDCSYGTEYKHDDTNHWQACTVCGYEAKTAHTLKLVAQATGTVITAKDVCDCGYQKDLGTVTLTVPASLTYHDGQTIAWTASDGLSLSFKWDASGDGFTDQPISTAGLDEGEHTLNIEVSHDSQTASSSILVTVKPATLTAAMVKLSPESVTYSGEEQKPAITVKQGETTLTDGMDYDVTYSTTDFTNVGMIIITITGKGNYKGTVEKTYTIKKAVLKADGTGVAKGTYGAKLSELSVTGLEAVIQGTATKVSGTWKLTGDTIPGVGDSGSYTAAFTPDSGADNYETLTNQVTLNIAQAEAPKPQAGTLYVQNNSEQSYQYDLTQLLPALETGKSYGMVSYTLGENAVNISGGYYTDGAKITGMTLTLPIQKVEADKKGNIGEVRITITSRNYKDMSAVINVESVDKIPVAITGVSVAERAYNGKAIERTGTPKAVDSSGNTVTIDGKVYKYTWQTADGKELSGAPKDAGSYLLTVFVDNGEYIGSSMISFVIDKAGITITADSMTVNKGSAKPALTYTASGLAEGEALAAEPELSCNADMNTAGRYPITVSGAAVPDSDNYLTEITYVEGALTVTASTSGGGSGGGSGGDNNNGSNDENNNGSSNGNGSGSENSGDNGQGSSSDNGGGNTAPGVPSVPAVTDTNQGTDTETAESGTGNTAKPGTGTEPESGTAEEERPDTGIPFIKGEDGKIGWNVIRDEEEEAEEGSVINVDMNGTTVVPGDIFDSIKGRDITITFDMGNGIIWSVDGKSVTTDKADDIDFTVRTGGSAVPVEIVNRCFANNITGEYYSIQLSLAYDGEFGFIAVLSVNLGEENAGYLASLYYYNEDAGELELICADEVAQDGTVSFAFTHASDYVVVVDRVVEEESGGVTEDAQPEETGGNDAAVPESPKTIQSRKTVWPWAAAIALVGTGAVAFIIIFLSKKKKADREES